MPIDTSSVIFVAKFSYDYVSRTSLSRNSELKTIFEDKKIAERESKNVDQTCYGSMLVTSKGLV